MANENKQAKLLLDLSILIYMALTIIGYFFYNQFLLESIQNFFPIAMLLFLMIITYAFRNNLEKMTGKSLERYFYGYVIVVAVVFVLTIVLIFTYPIS